MFPKLRLKYKPNLISLAGGLADLPITSPGELCMCVCVCVCVEGELTCVCFCMRYFYTG